MKREEPPAAVEARASSMSPLTHDHYSRPPGAAMQVRPAARSLGLPAIALDAGADPRAGDVEGERGPGSGAAATAPQPVVGRRLPAQRALLSPGLPGAGRARVP